MQKTSQLPFIGTYTEIFIGIKYRAMTIKITLQDQSIVWVSIEEVNVFSESKNIIEHTGEYICYLKFAQIPPYLSIGDPLKDENNKPLIFNNYQEGIEYVKKLLKKVKIA